MPKPDSRDHYSIPFDPESDIKAKLFSRLRNEEYSCLLDSCDLDSANEVQEYNWIAAYGMLSEICITDSSDPLAQLSSYHKEKQDWIFGMLSYDLKNDLHHQLHSLNRASMEVPDLCFFQPQHVIYLQEGTLHIESIGNARNELERLLDLDSNTKANDELVMSTKIESYTSKSQYLNTIKRIKHEIRDGNVYEVNYCLHHTARISAKTNSFSLYERLSQLSPAPYSAFFKSQQWSLVSTSPERYLRKSGSQIISQPIKGTRPRGEDEDEDLQMKIELQNSLKERAENVMIVDLVRNDLAHTCEAGSINVKELFGIYSYRQVHQMVSTISGTLREECDWTDVIRHSFPMGSMTGAPKIAAMKLIDEIENFKRGWYSGSVGYVKPNSDFDFNVVIRSLIHDAEQELISFSVGGAITYDSAAEEEWNECLLKAKAIRLLLNDSDQASTP